MTVTPFPLRPFVSLATLTIPSPLGALLPLPQEHSATGLRHSGHMRPLSVEYTNPLLLRFFAAMIQLPVSCPVYVHRHIRARPLER